MTFSAMSSPWRIFMKSFMMIAYVIIEILGTQDIKKKERNKERFWQLQGVIRSQRITQLRIMRIWWIWGLFSWIYSLNKYKITWKLIMKNNVSQMWYKSILIYFYKYLPLGERNKTRKNNLFCYVLYCFYFLCFLLF